jgi:putative transposase
MIEAEKAEQHISIAPACELLGVSRSGFNDWARRAPSDRALSDAWLLEKIRQIRDANRKVYGAPRMLAELRMEHGINVGRKRVERLMRAEGLSGLVAKQHGKPTVRVPGVRVADDLSNARFDPRPRMCCGWRISRVSAPGRACCAWLRSRTPTAAGSSAGAWPITCAPSLLSTR